MIRGLYGVIHMHVLCGTVEIIKISQSLLILSIAVALNIAWSVGVACSAVCVASQHISIHSSAMAVHRHNTRVYLNFYECILAASSHKCIGT